MNIKYNVINSKRYFELLNKNELNEEEQNETKTFEKVMSDAKKYNDYLVGPLKQNKDSYERGINQLATYQSTNPSANLTIYQKQAIDAYTKQNSYNDEVRENKIRRLEKKDSATSGFANSFILVLSVLATGIGIGIVLFTIAK